MTREKLRRAKGMMELGIRPKVLLGVGEVDAAVRPWCVHVLGLLPQNATTWGAGPQQFVFSCLEGKVSGRAIIPPRAPRAPEEGSHSQLLGVAGSTWCPLACRHISLIFACRYMAIFFCNCFSYKDISHWIQGPP